MTFGEKIYKLRKSSGLSQEELAAVLLVSRQAISKWESNDSMPDIGNLIIISKYFHTSLDYLLDDELESIDDIPVVACAVNRERNRFKMVVIATTMISLIVIFVVASYFNITVTVTAYFLLLIPVSMFLLLVIVLLKLVRFLESRLPKYSEGKGMVKGYSDRIE